MTLPNLLRGAALGLTLALATPMALAVAVTDVTLEGDNADAAGLVGGNDNAGAIGALFPPDDWSLLLKTDGGSAGSFNNVDYTMSGAVPGPGATSGNFILSWAANPADGLPQALDMVFVLKASPGFAGYLFEDVLITDESGSGAGTGSSSGTWMITFTNNGGNIPDLSHLSLYVREGDLPDTPPPPPNEVPAPGTLFLLGLGLLGFRMRRRH